MPETIGLKIILMPDLERNVILATGLLPVFKGNKGGFNFVCGNCRMVLAEDIRKDQVKRTVVRCFECWKYNEFI